MIDFSSYEHTLPTCRMTIFQSFLVVDPTFECNRLSSSKTFDCSILYTRFYVVLQSRSIPLQSSAVYVIGYIRSTMMANQFQNNNYQRYLFFYFPFFNQHKQQQSKQLLPSLSKDAQIQSENNRSIWLHVVLEEYVFPTLQFYR